MRPIGFSTGALAGPDFAKALSMMESAPADSVELSALRYSELRPLLLHLRSLDLKKYTYVSIHAPSSFSLEQENEITDLLHQYVPKAWPIVLHPDAIHDYGVWKSFGPQLAVENMDRRKPTGRSARELADIFARLPEAGLCFDLGHARQYDTTMTEAYCILKAFSGRLLQLHVSEVNASSRHDPLSFPAIRAFGEVAEMIPETIPVLIESRVGPSQLESEIQKAQHAFSARMLVPA